MTIDHLKIRLQQHLNALTGVGPRHHSNMPAVESAHVYITDMMKSYGYDVHRSKYGSAPHNVNLIAEIRTPDPRKAVIELGAHWDSVAGSPGADDNASGVAGLLEIARELSGDEPQPNIRFCFFGDEEDSDEFPQGRGGSREHVHQLESEAIDVEGAIILEMIGYRDSRPGSQKFPSASTDIQSNEQANIPGDFIAAVGNERSRDYVEAIVAAAESLEVAPVITADGGGDLARSDHSSYWEARRKGIMITDTANFRNPNYHTPADTVKTLDLTFAALVTHTLIGAVRELAG